MVGALVEGRRHVEDVAVGFGSGAYDHLGALSGGGKAGCMAVFLPFLGTFEGALLDVQHRLVDALVVFLGGQQLEILFRRDFQIDTEAVGIASGLAHQFLAGSGNALEVDISVEAVYLAQVFGHAYQAFHGVVGIAYHAGAEEKSFDVVAAVELDGEIHEFGDRESGPGNVVADTVDAIGTVVDAIVGEHDLEQGNAASVFGETVADAPSSHGVAETVFAAVPAHGSAGSAGNVVFGRFGQYLQFLDHLFVHLAVYF